MTDNGIASVASPYSVDDTAQRLQAILRDRGITIFATVLHSEGAASVGLAMRPTVLVIFGHPRTGTPVMLAAPSAAIDLPLKVLIWEDGDGAVWASYNRADYLQARHTIPAALISNLAGVAALVERAVARDVP